MTIEQYIDNFIKDVKSGKRTWRFISCYHIYDKFSHLGNTTNQIYELMKNHSGLESVKSKDHFDTFKVKL